ncbi:BTAD domain-containing putative transcriptional regulator [Thermodesulfobacterium hveragerdense]|uniref:BTAD domain-containing putative transcriptional regulator n=1 Tax=Thermodesulfobacterium hveragerdense TaxID=53424 RepID=UPI00041D7CD7|nr:BTAD domain-containing putative transcriptional regulator [Thermodesulfobacterium hveragerdense]
MKQFGVLILILTLWFLGQGYGLAETVVLTPQDKNKEQSFQHKKAGDELFKKGEIKKASKEYIEALRLYKDYEIEELITMATRISWGGKLKESEGILREVLKKDTQNRRAILQLARVLSWQGRQIEALSMVDALLKKDPADEEALLVKANALRFLGRSDKALELYDQILVKRDDFDARLGKAYAYGSLRIPSKLEENFKLLKPGYPYQEKDVKDLELYKKSIFSPAVLTGFSYFHDTDENEVYTYRLGFETYLKDLRVVGNYVYREGSDELRTSYSDELIFEVGKRLTNPLWGSVSFGVSQGGKDETFVVGGVGLNLLAGRGSVGLNVNKSVLTDTAELMEDVIKVLSINYFVNQSVTDRISLYANYNHRWYSDENQADSIQASFRYKINFGNPAVSLGYRVVYLDFKKQMRNGYFDPDDFWSNQLFLTIYYENPKVYVYLEPFIGHQTFRRYGLWSYDKAYGGTGTLGIKLNEKLNLEMSIEGGNYAAGTTSGWKYYQTGFLLKYVF